jgi:hypothetical protein
MPKTVLLAAGAVALAFAGVAFAGFATKSSSGSTYTYRASMAPGGEMPKPKALAGAKGTFAASVTVAGTVRTIRWKLSFSGLTGKAVAAHIHRGKAGVAGAVLVPLCGPCRSGQTGTVQVTKDAADALEHGLAYVNVHTTRNAPGEIRGQVKLVGEDTANGPSTGNGSPPATTTVDTSGGYGY